MRILPALVSLTGVVLIASVGAVGCSKSENAGIEEAKKQAEIDSAKARANNEVAAKISPPVPGGAKIPCDELIDPVAFGTALGEKDPVTVKDSNGGASEATASCSILRGGKAPTPAEQASLLKSKGHLGVLNGDELCNVTAFCWTIEDPDRFKKKCAEMKLKDDDSMGSYACVQVVATGEFDVNNYKFYDDDTKCILQVRGGPGMTDNATIATCAKTARDTITPAQIAVRPAGTPAATGSGSATP